MMRALISTAFAAVISLFVLFASACSVTAEAPSADTRVPGVSDTEIVLGTHLPLSGSPAAAYAPIGYGAQAYFDMINDTEGGVYGRKIRLIIGDDHYNPPDTVEVVRRLVEQDQVFAMILGLGESTHAAVYTYLEQNGVPDMYITSGIERWTVPLARSRFGFNPSYLVEGRILGKYVVDTSPGKQVGLLIQNDELGDNGEQGIREALEGTSVSIAGVEKYEAANFDVTSQTQRLRAAGADVLIAYAIPPQAANMVKVAREVLTWDVPIVVSGINAAGIFIDLAGRQNVEGVVSVVFGHQLFEKDNPGIQRHIALMQKYAPDVEISNFTLYGAYVAEMFVETLRRAGTDLTRDGLITAAESIRDYNCDVCLAPVNMSATDHRPIEIEQYIRVTNGDWVPFGEPINFESTTE